jgi:autotransporter-associated beta strand protein
MQVSLIQAQSVWNSTTGTWSTDANWLPTGVPVGSTSTSLIFDGSTDYTTSNDLGNFSLNQLRFNNTSGTITLGALPVTNALQFVSSSLALLPAITASGAGNTTISTPITWDGNTTVTNSGAGTLLLNGSQSYANGTKQTFINSGAGILTLADGITYASSGSSTGLVLNVINNNSVANSFNVGDLGALGNVTLRVGGSGTVRFAGSAGDLFSSSAILQVLSGATFDLNGNAESMGAIHGEGTIRMSGNAGITVASAGYYRLSGKLTSNGGLAVAGTTHTLELSSSTSDYTGTTSVTAGRLIVSANAPSGSAGALGNATSEVLVGNTSGTSNATLLLGMADVTLGRNVRLQSGNSGVAMLGALNASGTSTFSGNVTLGTNSAAAKALTIFSTPGGTLAFDGNLQRATSATGATDTLTLRGGGMVILRGSNTFTGVTTVNGGTLQLDHSTNNNPKFSSSAALILSGGSLSLMGHQSEATAVSVSELILGSSSAPTGGGGRIIVTSALDQNAVLSVNAITRYSGATMDFSAINTGSGIASISTSTANTTAGILGAYATSNLTSWAANDGSGQLTALASGNYSTVFASGGHTSLSGSTALPSGGATTHTLRFTSSTALTYNATAGTLFLESGGILMVPATGSTTIGATTRRGAISTSGEFVVHQNSTNGTLTIHSPISSTGLTKSGNGTLILTGSSTYAGNTVINGGTLSVTAGANLGVATSDVVINGGTLALPSGTLGTLNAANRVIIIGPAGGTLNFTATQSFEGTGLAGTGNLVLSGNGTLAFGSTASTYNGHIFINNGQIRMNSPQLNNVASISVATGASYHIEDDATDTFSLATGGRLILNGNGLGSNGALRLTDQTPTLPRNNPVTTFNRNVELQTTSRIQVDNGTTGGNPSRLTLTGNVTGDGGLTKAGNGLLILTARDNDYRGATMIQAGTLGINLGHDRLPTATTITLGSGTSSGTLQLNGHSQSIAGLDTSGTGAANAVIGGSSTANSLLTLNLNSGTQTYAGTLGGTGLLDNHGNNQLNFVKDGAGTFVLGEASTYSGATTVAAGTLTLGHAQALGAGGVAYASGAGGTTVSTGATLDLNGQSTIHEVITLNGHGTGGVGALVNNSPTTAILGGGVASLTVTALSTTGWSAGATVTLDAPGSGTPASATALLGLTTSSYTLTSGGSGYGLVPTVTISGGTGASAFALVGVTSTSFTVPTPVPGTTTTYSVAPAVTLQNGATGEAVIDGNGYVIGINVLTPGSNFVTTPTATFSGGTASFAGTNPTASGNNSNYTVTGITLVNAGSGFTTSPTITISGGAGSGAAATGNDGAFALNGFAITDHGSGYTSVPNVGISGGTASVAANLGGITLASDSSIGGSGDLIIHSVISGGHALTKVGAGTTVLAANNTFSGVTTVSAGNLQVGLSGAGTSGSGNLIVSGNDAVLSGSGTVAAMTTSIILGTVKPGDNGGSGIGTLSTQSLSFTPASTTTVAELQIAGSTSTADLAFDTLHITGDLGMNSFSRIVIDGSSYSATPGDVFELIDWSGLLSTNGFTTGTKLRTGANADLNEGLLDLPDISGLGFWDIAFGSGILKLTVIVPEPGRAMLLALGMGAMLTRRRRSRVMVGL